MLDPYAAYEQVHHIFGTYTHLCDVNGLEFFAHHPYGTVLATFTPIGDHPCP